MQICQIDESQSFLPTVCGIGRYTLNKLYTLGTFTSTHIYDRINLASI